MAGGIFSRIRTDAWICLVVIVSCQLLLRESADYPEAAAVYPRGLLIFLTVLATAAIAEILIKKKPAPTKDVRPWKERPYVWALCVYGIVAAYVVLLEPLGFILATLLFMIAMMTYFGERKLWLMLILGAAFIGFVYGSFIFMLNVPMPLLPQFM
ncbi:MAG: hypothetical protein DELT_01990 [Desulfovibrio sp.]